MKRKPPEDSQRHVVAAVAAIKNAGSLRDLYVAIHGRDPGRLELQGFSNRLNPARSNPSADFLGLCVDRLPTLHDMTVAEFFGIKTGG